MDYVIVGTAGHVDHGKTVLVKALTGKDTDRLREEKERGISIELGFAPFQLPDGTNVGIVDVPGHERFIRQMLAGVAGIDLVLLVIAADEGVMPQTREHLDIIDLLQVKSGIIVITKSDLVDEDWLDLVKEEVRETVAPTVLGQAPLVAVSAVTGAGMAELRRVMEEKIAQTPAKSASGRMRMPIDRVFSVTGFGTVATGTLWSGVIKVGDKLEIMPEGIESRVRSLQVHGTAVDIATAGQRVAVNLTNVEVEELHRGQMLSEPNLMEASYRIDVQLKLLELAAKPLKQRSRIRLYLGTAEVFARINLLDREKVEPGETVFCQLLLEEPLVSLRLDRFVIRTYSPMFTIGGGLVVDPAAEKHKRYRDEVISRLATKLKGTPEQLLLQHLGQLSSIVSAAAVQQELGLTDEEFNQAVSAAESDGKVKQLIHEGMHLLIAADVLQQLSNKLVDALSRYHRNYPLRPGMAKEELRSRLFSSWEGKRFNALLHLLEDGVIRVSGNAVALKEFNVQPSSRQQQQLDKITAMLEESVFQPPDWPDVVAEIAISEAEAAELLAYLTHTGRVERINEQLVFARTAIDEAKERLRNLVEQQGAITLGEVRDVLGSSRKYVLPLLEYFDQIKFTKRVQDKRILFKR